MEVGDEEFKKLSLAALSDLRSFLFKMTMTLVNDGHDFTRVMEIVEFAAIASLAKHVLAQAGPMSLDKLADLEVQLLSELTQVRNKYALIAERVVKLYPPSAEDLQKIGWPKGLPITITTDPRLPEED